MDIPELADTVTYFSRLEGSGSILTAMWSKDGNTWNEAFSRDMGTQLDGLDQQVVISGGCWFNPVGSYADYDYVCFEVVPIPAAVCLLASGLIGLLGLRKVFKI